MCVFVTKLQQSQDSTKYSTYTTSSALSLPINDYMHAPLLALYHGP